MKINKTRRKGDCFLNFEDARDFVKKLNFKNRTEWREYCRSGKKPKDIPANPSLAYKDKWKNNFDWIGRKKERYWSSRKYIVNNDFFKIWSSDMAYILGFWWADGWISGNRFCISQEKSRVYILRQILLKMSSDYPIRERKWGTCLFSIESKEVCKNIISLGGKERKSRDILFPNIPKEFLADFVRGYFDGDGCICKMIDKRRTERSRIKKYNYIANFTSGSKEFIYGLLKSLRKNIIGFRGYIQVKKPIKKTVNGIKWKSKKCYVLVCSINDTRRLNSFMYNDNKTELKLIEKQKIFNGIGEISSLYLTKKFISFQETKKIVAEKCFKNEKEWKEYARANNAIPLNPQKVYKKEWEGWGSFLNH